MPLAAIGQLRERVTLQEPVTVEDSMGGRSVEWTHPIHQYPTWASVEPLSLNEREKLQSLQMTAIAAYRVRMRYRTDVKPSWRVLWRDRTLEIQTVQDTDGDPSMHSRKRRLTCECTEVEA